MKYITTIFVLISILISPLVLATEGEEHIASHMLQIVELQTASDNSSSEEFVEIANTTSTTQDTTGLRLEYKSRSGTTWSTKAELSGEMIPYGRVLLANYDLHEDQQELGSGIANSGGHVRIINDSDEVIDLVAWGDGDSPEQSPAPAPVAGGSMKRITDEDGYFIDSNDNSSDFFNSDTPTPHSDPLILITESETNESSEQVNSEEQQSETANPVNSESGQAPSVHLDIQGVIISEVVPDPTKPLTDAEHEMIELHNTTAKPIRLSGSKLTSGSRGQYNYQIPDISLKPGEYFSLYSGDTGLTLSNSGGIVTLADDQGVEISNVEYEKAKAGKSWALVAGEWVWTTPSPNQANFISSDSDASQTDSAGQVKSDAAAPPEKRNVEYGDDGSSTSQTSEEGSKSSFDDSQDDKINNAILAGVGSLALLYMIYEYRNEIRTFFQRLKRHVTDRRKNRPTT